MNEPSLISDHKKIMIQYLRRVYLCEMDDYINSNLNNVHFCGVKSQFETLTIDLHLFH